MQKKRSEKAQRAYDLRMSRHVSPASRGGNVLPRLHLVRCAQCRRTYFTAGLAGEEGSKEECCSA